MVNVKRKREEHDNILGNDFHRAWKLTISTLLENIKNAICLINKNLFQEGTNYNIFAIEQYILIFKRKHHITA